MRLWAHAYVVFNMLNRYLISLFSKDYGGSAIIYLTAGVAALIGTIFLGPRFGRFEPRTLPLFGHSIPVRKEKMKINSIVAIDVCIRLHQLVQFSLHSVSLYSIQELIIVLQEKLMAIELDMDSSIHFYQELHQVQLTIFYNVSLKVREDVCQENGFDRIFHLKIRHGRTSSSFETTCLFINGQFNSCRNGCCCWWSCGL